MKFSVELFCLLCLWCYGYTNASPISGCPRHVAGHVFIADHSDPCVYYWCVNGRFYSGAPFPCPPGVGVEPGFMSPATPCRHYMAECLPAFMRPKNGNGPDGKEGGESSKEPMETTTTQQTTETTPQSSQPTATDSETTTAQSTTTDATGDEGDSGEGSGEEFVMDEKETNSTDTDKETGKEEEREEEEEEEPDELDKAAEEATQKPTTTKKPNGKPGYEG